MLAKVKNMASDRIGIIAGGGSIAEQVVHHCQQQDTPFFIVCLKGFASEKLAEYGPHIWIRLGKVGAAIEALHKFSANKVLLIGDVKRPSLSSLLPDKKGLALLKYISKNQNNNMGDDKLLSLIGAFIEQEGFQVISSQELLQDQILNSQAGALGRFQPNEEDLLNIKLGQQAARAIGCLDIGQSVVVQQNIILGLEAVEGTDSLIKRCGQLKKEGDGPILIKMCKPQQDMRYDVPTIGPQTIELMHKNGLS